MEFLAICQLSAGDFPMCPLKNFTGRLDDFKTCVEGELAELDCFNYLTESKEDINILYNVCKYNYMIHYEKDLKGEVVAVQDEGTFVDLFPDLPSFMNLFQ